MVMLGGRLGGRVGATACLMESEEHSEEFMALQPAGVGIHYRFLVDDKEFKSPNQIITGQQLREIAHVDPRSNIFLSVGPKRDHNPDLLIHNATTINLANSGTDVFYTLRRPTMDIY